MCLQNHAVIVESAVDRYKKWHGSSACEKLFDCLVARQAVNQNMLQFMHNLDHSSRMMHLEPALMPATVLTLGCADGRLTARAASEACHSTSEVSLEVVHLLD